MSKNRSKADIKNNISEAVDRLNKLLVAYADSTNGSYNKKADLVSYWIKSFTDYIEKEDDFNPSRLIRYSRGDVIRVNFGFRIGKELGGLHYAVVIDNNNSRAADVITVIPLSSTNGKTIHKSNLDLGQELYNKAITQYNKLNDFSTSQIDEFKAILKLIPHDSDMDERKSAIIAELEAKLDAAEATMDLLKVYKKEINKLKTGTMAIMNQITTVSKQRIYVPKKSTDYLYGIKLSDSTMDKLTDKLSKQIIIK